MSDASDDRVLRQLHTVILAQSKRIPDWVSARRSLLERYWHQSPQTAAEALHRLQKFCAQGAGSPAARETTFFLLLELRLQGAQIRLEALQDPSRLTPVAEYALGKDPLFFCVNLHVPEAMLDASLPAQGPSYLFDVAIGRVSAGQELLVAVLELAETRSGQTGTAEPDPLLASAGIAWRRLCESELYTDPTAIVREVLQWAEGATGHR